MTSKVYSTLSILAATAVPPCAVLAYWFMKNSGHELLLMLGIYLLAHIGIWLVLIPAFKKFPRTSWAVCTLFYPLIALAGVLLMFSVVNPYAFVVGLLWLGPALYIHFAWVAIPVSGMSSTMAYLLTRIITKRENTERGTAAPAS